MPTIVITDAQTGEVTEREMTAEEIAELTVSPEELEAEVQRLADDITQNGERDVAMAMATVDLVIAVRDGQLTGLTRAQIRSAYRDRVVTYLRQRRGI